ncbi:MAG: tetratricopeptide repeat protein [Myxococcota bacterium]
MPRRLTEEDSTALDRAIAIRHTQPDEAIAILTALLTKEPTWPSLYGLRGDALWGKGYLVAGLEDFRRVLGINPRSGLASLAVVEILWELGDLDQAIAQARSFLRRGDVKPRWRAAHRATLVDLLRDAEHAPNRSTQRDR